MVKLVSLLYRKRGITNEQFYSYWREKHGPLVARVIPFARRYVQNHPLEWPGLTHEADGIVELWFDTEEHVRKYLQWRDTAEGRELKDDEDRFQDFKRTRRFVVYEYQFETTGWHWNPGASLPDAGG